MVKLGGGGKHLYDVTYYNLAMNNWVCRLFAITLSVLWLTWHGQFGTFSKVTFFVALGFIKLSIVSFNMRLTGLSSRKWMYAHWTFFGILVLFILTSIFLVTFQCNPVVAGWDSIATGKLDNPPKCLSELATSNPLSIWHVTMDFCLLAVPVLVLWKIQVPRSTKARLIALFSVGAVCCFGSVMRQLSQAKLKTDPTCTLPQPVMPRCWLVAKQTLDNYTALVYWSVVDLAMSLIVASLPVLGSVIPVFGLFSRKPTKPSGASSSYVMSKPKSSHIPRDLHGKESREGIMRQDEVELEYHTHDSLALEEGSEHRGTISKDAYGVEQRTMPWAASNRIERG